MNTDLVAYYKARATVYEKIYQKPERQDELAQASEIIQGIFKEKQVLEIACGTGYWTEKIAQTAGSVLATDINEAVLAIAMQKTYPRDNVEFAVADIYNYHGEAKYEGLFGGFIFSHILLQQTDAFISTINNFVQPGGTVVLMDNNYVPGSSTAIAETDKQGNTYQMRKLEDGSLHRVLKNFPGERVLRGMVSGYAREVEFFNLKHYWVLKYILA